MEVRKIRLIGKKIQFINNVILINIILFSIIFMIISDCLIINTASADDPDNFTLKWTTYYGEYTSWSSPVAEDINGDGIYEIFIAGRYIDGSKSGIFCINGSNGNIIWQKNFTSLIEWHIPCAIGDLDNDGTYELVHASGYNTIARNCEDGSIFWEVSTDSGWGTPAIADTDDSGIPYVYVGDNSAFGNPVTLSKLYGNNGTVAASTNVISYTCYSGVSIADLDRDGEFEIVMSDSGDSHCFDEDLNELWSTSYYTSESHCAVLTNVTGDGDLEVIILEQDMSPPYNGGIHVYYAGGTEVPGMNDGTLGLGSHCQPAVYDIDKDGHVEVLTSYGGTECSVWDLIDWSEDATLEKGSEPPDIANVLGDSDLEIISPEAWVDDQVDIYDSAYNNIDTIGGYGNPMYGMNTVTQDIDGDGLNELIISGPGRGNMSVYDTLAVAPTPRVRTDTEYYSERRTAAGEFIAKIGGKCTLSGETPSDTTIDVSVLTTSLNVTVNEPDGEPLYWTIETSPDIGSNYGDDESNGSKVCNISGLSSGTTYMWYVNVTDGTNWKRQTYTFTTEEVGFSGNDYYVNGTSGNDGNNGSLMSPWKTVQHAMDTLTAGDTVYIMEGIYVGYNTPWSGVSSGNSSHWITYTNYNDDLVILDGSNDNDLWDGLLWFYDNHHIRITGLTFRNSSSMGILWEENVGGSHNITIDNCTFYNCSNSAINFKGNNNKICDVLVENNIIYDVENGWNAVVEPVDECISLYNCNRFEVRHNIMYNNHRINIDAKSGSGNGTIHDNIINASCSSPWYGVLGIYVDAYDDDCENISIYKNIVWGNHTGYTIGTEQGGTLDDIKIYNNIYNGTGNAFQINDYTSVPGSHLKTNCSFINNVAGGDTFMCFQLTDANSSFVNFTIRNNIMNGSVGINIGSGQLDLSYHNIDHNLFNVTTSIYWGDNAINGSPCFVDPANGDYSLLSNSPAVNNGSSVSAPPFDFKGVSRPQGSEVDIGAFEFEFMSEDTTLPTISDISIITSNPLDTNINFGWENISCVVTDNIAVDDVNIRIVHPDGVEINSEMTKIADSDCYYYNSSWSDYGNYSYFIWASDTSDNTKYSDNFYFSLSPNWDINSDGRCNILDLTMVSNHYNEIGSNGWIREDVDNNGMINILDMSLVSNHYQESWYT